MQKEVGRSRRLLITLVAALALTVVGSTTVLAVTFARSGKAVTGVKTVTATAFQTMNSIEWLDMPEMSTTVNVPASQKALLIVTFSAEVNCTNSEAEEKDYCMVRVLVDGAEAPPGPVVFDSNTDNTQDVAAPVTALDFAWETNSMQFVVGPVNSGSHTVKVQWSVLENGFDERAEFWTSKRTLTVLRSRV